MSVNTNTSLNTQPMQHIMLDIETLGNGNNAAIIAIGAVFFEPYHNALGAEFYVSIKPASAAYYGSIDAATMQWWMKQSSEARALFNDPNAVGLKDALLAFSQWLSDTTEYKQRQVWGNGCSFDNVILANAYKAAKMRQPWPYSGDRDVRTLVELGKSLGGVNPKKSMVFDGIAHNALDDAKHQAKYISAIYHAFKK